MAAAFICASAATGIAPALAGSSLGSVRVAVRDSAQQPLIGAPIEVQSGGSYRQVFTDRHGVAVVSNLAPGRTLIRLTTEAAACPQLVTIMAGETVQAQMRTQPADAALNCTAHVARPQASLTTDLYDIW
ncbi:MAG TPA: hypothetical protein VMW12_06350 [Candidatus Dormibacteraeota bacterium]|nr:hypothetical protein [Candidatus Dormibacteraeota bacterium]